MINILIIAMFFIFYIIGYILGSLKNKRGGGGEKKTSSFFDKKAKKESIKIDERKVITSISTNEIEKKYSELGEKKISNEDISSSVNKLKQLKK